MKKMSMALAAVLAIGVVASIAEARGVTPINGMAWYAAQASCFDASWYNRLENSNCAYGVVWKIDAPTDSSANYHNVTMFGKGNGTSAVDCWLTSMAADGQTRYTIEVTRAQASYAVVQGTYSLYVPQTGQIHADCTVPQYGGLSAFHYDP